MFCPKCNERVEDGNKFCSNCGTQLSPEFFGPRGRKTMMRDDKILLEEKEIKLIEGESGETMRDETTLGEPIDRREKINVKVTVGIYTKIMLTLIFVMLAGYLFKPIWTPMIRPLLPAKIGALIGMEPTIKAYQDFPNIRVGLESLQVLQEGENLSVILNFFNKTKKDLLIALQAPFQKTYASSAKGEFYQYTQSSGIGTYYTPGYTPTEWLFVPAESKATASFLFRRDKQVAGLKATVFSFSTALVMAEKLEGLDQPGNPVNINVSFTEIKP